MTWVGVLHILLAVTALLVGAAIVFAKKGTRGHRLAGWVYVVSMFGLNLSALSIYRLSGRWNIFHILALVSLATLFAGLIPVRTKRPRGQWLRRHLYYMSWSYVGLVAAAMAEMSTRVGRFSWMAVAASAAVPVLIGALVISRYEARMSAA
jgi:uncharacterized membrane protein